MNKDRLRVLVVRQEGRRTPGDVRGGIERRRLLSALTSAGIKVQDDSGGGLLVVEVADESQEEALRAIGRVEVLPLDVDIVERAGDLDAHDALFARALAVRLDPGYREAKRTRVAGESPEERLLRSAPCTVQED